MNSYSPVIIDKESTTRTSRLITLFTTSIIIVTLCAMKYQLAIMAKETTIISMGSNNTKSSIIYTKICRNNNSTSSSLSEIMGLNGTVSECSCSFSDIDEVNDKKVRPLLKRIVNTPFFSHFKIDLCSECELWKDEPLCMLRDCGVCECDEAPEWAFKVDGMPLTGPDCKHVEDNIVTTTDSHISSEWQNPISMSHSNELIGTSRQKSEDTGVVVNLRLNPESYTGYNGESAAKVWSAIHSTNCFQPSSTNIRNETDHNRDQDPIHCALPAEQRLYNRLISGLHSSISLHISHTYCLELDQNQIGECKRWGKNSKIAHDRVLNHPDRIENLYVAFALLLRAVVKAGPAVTSAVPKDDPFFSDSLSTWTDTLLPELINMAHDCPNTFNEHDLLLDPDIKYKKVELQRRFNELQKIIQCVGCDRCKLWGTLQTLGIGTALRILFSNNDDIEGTLQLSRQEAVALVHTLERLSSSLVFAYDIRRESSNILNQ